MQRILLTREDQKVVNRWRLGQLPASLPQADAGYTPLAATGAVGKQLAPQCHWAPARSRAPSRR
jgi:hypothetical protein